MTDEMMSLRAIVQKGLGRRNTLRILAPVS